MGSLEKAHRGGPTFPAEVLETIRQWKPHGNTDTRTHTHTQEQPHKGVGDRDRLLVAAGMRPGGQGRPGQKELLCLHVRRPWGGLGDTWAPCPGCTPLGPPCPSHPRSLDFRQQQPPTSFLFVPCEAQLTLCVGWGGALREERPRDAQRVLTSTPRRVLGGQEVEVCLRGPAGVAGHVPLSSHVSACPLSWKQMVPQLNNHLQQRSASGTVSCQGLSGHE